MTNFFHELRLVEGDNRPSLLFYLEAGMIKISI
ncbi:hypothetical protein VD0002_g10139 [Verticillium dahliae]|uniref:Uncharacterized protein n=1 Tax=Verticillium dahliae TaxID=27337 RepID=A0AA44WRZ0_VERDA|nr:hypothetical protein BJF96_g548 [Verticillium dahliae]PNH39707.1 hypothetical protein VD0003_g10167 [Verticillium dahliae]PNH52832.1 hypothetical protein VD0002_g10139 [Verticillium dahliae]